MLQYHSGDKYATAATEAKAAEYGVRGFPSMYFNGANLVVGGSNASYSQQKTVLDKELAKTPSAAIAATLKTTGGITISATISNTGAAAITDAKLYVVLYEDLGADEHRYTVRDILAPAAVASLAPGVTREFSFSSSYTGSTANLNTVVYLKAADGEILQAALAPGHPAAAAPATTVPATTTPAATIPPTSGPVGTGLDGSITDVQLSVDVLNNISVMEKARDPECKTMELVSTQVTQWSALDSEWKERWIIDSCGITVAYDVTFIPIRKAAPI